MEYVIKGGKKLRCGFTTGSCAAAAAKGAAMLLITGEKPKAVTIPLPSGERIEIPVSDCFLKEDSAVCKIIKDAGDDPDVTHGMEICARVSKIPQGVNIVGGVGIGKVTKPGLSCPVGSFAINPVPQRMIESAVSEVLPRGGLEICIFAPQGEEIAKKTFNERLGIMGGISVLGTTGIVEPMSEAALIETIKLEITGKSRDKILLLAPGNYGLDFIREELKINIDSAVKISNYMGEALDYALYCGFKRILLVGHIGKLCKLSAGIMNTHSKTADGRNEIFTAAAGICGGKPEVLEEIMAAVTTDEIHRIITKAGIEKQVYQRISQRIRVNLDYRVRGEIKTEFISFSKENGLLIKSENSAEYTQEIRSYDL